LLAAFWLEKRRKQDLKNIIGFFVVFEKREREQGGEISFFLWGKGNGCSGVLFLAG